MLLTSHSCHSQMMPAPMGICFLKNATLDMAQSFCRLASVDECMQGDGKDATQFQCYLKCGSSAQQEEEVYNNCTEYDMECYEGVTCILPPKRMKDEQDGY